MSITADFFHNRLDQMIDLRRPLAVLANRMPWQEIRSGRPWNFIKSLIYIDKTAFFGYDFYRFSALYPRFSGSFADVGRCRFFP